MSVDTKRFASNLMEMDLGENKVELYFRQLKLVNDGLNRNEELRQFIDDIQYSPTDKVEKLRETFGSALNDNVINTFFLVNNTLNRRHTELVLLHDFLELYYESKGMLFGEVRSVRVLDEETLNKLEKAISENLGQKVALENIVDEDILGGVKVTVRDYVWMAVTVLNWKT